MKHCYAISCPECGQRYEVTFECRSRDVDWRLSKLEQEPCPQCVAKKRQKDAEQAAKDNAQAGMPTLQGSEKQVPWAETIRAKILHNAQSLLAEDHSRKHHGEYINPAVGMVLYHMKNQSLAEWYLQEWQQNLINPHSFRQYVSNVARDFLAGWFNHILQPVEVKKPGCAEVELERDYRSYEQPRITVWYPYDQSLIALLKKEGLKWDGEQKVWYEDVRSDYLTIRAAQIARILLDAGFTVCINDLEAARRAHGFEESPYQQTQVVWSSSNSRSWMARWLWIVKASASSLDQIQQMEGLCKTKVSPFEFVIQADPPEPVLEQLTQVFDCQTVNPCD